MSINMTTKITKWGNSYGFRIPKAIMNKLAMEENTVVDFEVKGKSLFIKPQKKSGTKITKYNLKDLLKDYDPKTKHDEYDWGKPVGKEIW